MAPLEIIGLSVLAVSLALLKGLRKA